MSGLQIGRYQCFRGLYSVYSAYFPYYESAELVHRVGFGHEDRVPGAESQVNVFHASYVFYLSDRFLFESGHQFAQDKGYHKSSREEIEIIENRN